MEIILDTRETDLLPIFKRLLVNENAPITFSTKPLNIGDIVISLGTETIIFERKSVSDLAASISDGRYKEQSFRLNAHTNHNHNIYYIIEGSIKMYNSTKNARFSRIKSSVLYSTLFTLSYYKGFSVLKTDDITETAQLIIRIADKFYRETTGGKKTPFYKNTEPNNMDSTNIDSTNIDSTNNAQPGNEYVDTLKTSKKSFITKDNIAKIMLMQIPGVSLNSANVITQKYKTLVDLICALQEDDSCLDGITYNTATGKPRKINKTCIKNLKEFLLNEE